MQDLGGDRVEEGLRQLRLLVIDELADKEQFGALPHLIVERGCSELAIETLDAFTYAIFVIADALAHRVLYLVPASLLETLFGARTGLAEQAVVAVEAFDQRLRDGLGSCLGAGGIDGNRASIHAGIMSEA